MWMSIAHDKKLGPLSTHARVSREKSVAAGGAGGRDEEDSSMDMPTYDTNTRNQQPQAAYEEGPRFVENEQFVPNERVATNTTSDGAYAPYSNPAPTMSQAPYRSTWV